MTDANEQPTGGADQQLPLPNQNEPVVDEDASYGDLDDEETLGGRADPAEPASKDPADWVTGDEPMTAAQKSYLDTLAREAGEEIPADITKAEASEHIERLQVGEQRREVARLVRVHPAFDGHALRSLRSRSSPYRELLS